MEVSKKEDIEQGIQDINLQSTSEFTFKNIIDIFNVEKLRQHKIFLMFVLIALIGVGFIIWRSFMKKPTSIDEEDNEKGTQEMMDELGVNLTKNAMGEHMTSESDKDEERMLVASNVVSPFEKYGEVTFSVIVILSLPSGCVIKGKFVPAIAIYKSPV